MKQEVEAMLRIGVVEEFHSAWCSPIVLVPKRDGSLRFCNDFQSENDMSMFDVYPMPRWFLSLQRFSFSVVHRSGANIGNTDALSRKETCIALTTVPPPQWCTACQPPGRDLSRPGGRQSLHHDAMAPSAGRARSQRALRPGLIGVDCGWWVI